MHATRSAARRPFRAAVDLALLVTITITVWVTARAQVIRARSDRGSETVEKAILAAVGLGLATGLGFAITALVHKYQNQINPQ